MQEGEFGKVDVILVTGTNYEHYSYDIVQVMFSWVVKSSRTIFRYLLLSLCLLQWLVVARLWWPPFNLALGWWRPRKGGTVATQRCVTEDSMCLHIFTHDSVQTHPVFSQPFRCFCWLSLYHLRRRLTPALWWPAWDPSDMGELDVQIEQSDSYHWNKASSMDLILRCLQVIDFLPMISQLWFWKHTFCEVKAETMQSMEISWSFRDFHLVPTLPDERWITGGHSASSSWASGCKDGRLKCWI